MRSWKNKSGMEIKKTYYYWYKSIRRGQTVKSQCIGPATESDYIEYVENN